MLTSDFVYLCPMKPLILGTAQWGWGTDRPTAFHLLEAWIKTGLREIDAATNYPINRIPEDFRASEGILKDFIDAHGLKNELSITMKVGSMDNMRGPEINLSPSFILMMDDEYSRLFGGNLSGIMLHWDNRDNLDDIGESLNALAILNKKGIVPGLSGIQHPELYAAANAQYGLSFDIEVKHNVFVSDLQRYAPFRTAAQLHHRFLAYGINAGGVKLSGQYHSNSTFARRGGAHEIYAARIAGIEAALPKFNTITVRPPVITMNQLGLLYALVSPDIDGVLVGARTPAQITEAVEIRENTMMFDYGDILKL